MANHVFLGLAILSLGVTMVRCYGPYHGYGPRDEGIRQTRRCPTCPPDCPEALSSSWYDTPLVYGQPPRYRLNNGDYNPHFGGSLNYGNSPCSYSNSRFARGSARNSNASPMESMVSDSNAEESFDPAPSFEPIERRAIMPYGFRNSHAFTPERYQESGNFGIVPNAENRRVSRHYGNSYENLMRDQSLHQDSMDTNEKRRWSDVSFQPSEMQAYENIEDVVYDDRAKAIESPSLNKRVYVVYRADADPSMDEEDLETSLNSRQPETLNESSMLDTRNPMRDLQLEQDARRVMDAAARQNFRETALYNLQNRRGIYYNDRETEHAALYNPRRAYNEALYQRFNSDNPMDQLQNRKAFASGFRASDVVYPPIMNFDRYALSGAGNTEDLEPQDDSARTENVQDNIRYDVNRESSAWEGKYWQQPIEETNDEKNGNINGSKRSQETFAISENVDVDRSEGTSTEQNQKKSEEAKDFSTGKRQVTFETSTTLPKNYRTYSRSTSEADKDFSGRKETEKGPKIEVTAFPSIKAQNVERMMKEMNPDFLEDMEKPPTVTEPTLKLNFDAPESST